LSRQNSQRPLVITARDVRRLGTHAIYIDGSGVRVVTVAETRGSRPWAHIPETGRETLLPLRRAGGGRPARTSRPTVSRAPAGSVEAEDDDHR
jgi:hypothetical protein